MNKLYCINKKKIATERLKFIKIFIDSNKMLNNKTIRANKRKQFAKKKKDFTCALS